ncbi:MAG: flagellar assembly protein FliW [Geminicoccaceae bacterium]|nr:flagellar assembly protein FliW [Geminicoccaceae bacterium]
MQTTAASSLPTPNSVESAPTFLECGPILFPSGLFGFPGLRGCRLEPLGAAAGSFLLLRAEEPDGPRFVVAAVAEPGAVFGPAAAAALRAASGIPASALRVLLIVTLSRSVRGTEAFVNLRAPIAVDARTRTARQIVLPDPNLPLRRRLAPEKA